MAQSPESRPEVKRKPVASPKPFPLEPSQHIRLVNELFWGTAIPREYLEVLPKTKQELKKIIY